MTEAMYHADKMLKIYELKQRLKELEKEIDFEDLKKKQKPRKMIEIMGECVLYTIRIFCVVMIIGIIATAGEALFK